VMKKPYVATASDGSAHRQGLGDRPHPRSYGTFPRKFRYALDEGLMTIEEAVRSCSGLPAEILGLTDRGKIRGGAIADIVVFDPATFRDQATFDDPTRYATGVRHLFVNGIAVVEGGESKAALPGRAIRLEKR
jgi:N-acyl-D-aspartate/D-glutamate deacylase